MESKEKRFEKNWDIFVLTGMPWKEILDLSDSDRENMFGKTVEAKERTLEQIRVRDEFLKNNPQPTQA